MKRQRGMPSSTQGATPASESTTEAASGSGTDYPMQGPMEWVPRDLLIPYILLAISLQRAHGYLIEAYLKNLGFFGVDKSVLYRTLRQLEKDGIVVSVWELGAVGPARRVYTLTDVGRIWLNNWSTALEGYRQLIDRFFTLYSGGGGVTDSDSRESEPNT